MEMTLKMTNTICSNAVIRFISVLVYLERVFIGRSGLYTSNRKYYIICYMLMGFGWLYRINSIQRTNNCYQIVSLKTVTSSYELHLYVTLYIYFICFCLKRFYRYCEKMLHNFTATLLLLPAVEHLMTCYT